MPIKVTPIIPRKVPFGSAGYKRAIENFLDMRAADIKVDFWVTTRTWKRRPTFTIAVASGERLIYTTDLIYKYVSRGTRPHIIRPKNASALAFYSVGFRPKTRARYIGSNQGASANKGFVVTKTVKHPGNEARQYEEVIREKWNKELPTLLNQALTAEALRQEN